MTYDEALAWVHSLRRLAARPGLERMRALLAALGNPQDRLRFVHVAGTNGKGSVVAMVSAIVAAAGYKVGANISPYVLDFRERFQINGIMVGEERLATLMDEVKRAAETLEDPLIEFEAVTAVALLYFAQENCDLVCLEAGLGGRLDSTNVVEHTLVACITRIGYDHTDILGERLEQIAAEKCGIIKLGCTVVSYPEQPVAAADEIEQCAAELDCPLIVPQTGQIMPCAREPFTNRVTYKEYNIIEVPFLGWHQALNAAMAVEVAGALREKGFAIQDDAVVKGIAAAKMPARIEVLSREPLIIVDGAHNRDSAEALAAVLSQERLSGMSAVVGVLQDKDVLTILKILAPFVNTLYVLAPASPRAMTAQELACMAEAFYTDIVLCDNLDAAMEKALGNASNGVLFFGSLYLAAEVKTVFATNDKYFKFLG